MKQNNRPVYKKRKMALIAGIMLTLFNSSCCLAYAETPVNIAINGEGSDAVKIIMTLTLISVAPFALLLMTCFPRIIIVLSFLRNALGLQQSPPNQVLIGLAIFITFFIMSPVVTEIDKTALEPYNAGQIQAEEFLTRASVPLKDFMLKQIDGNEVKMFVNLSSDTDYAHVKPMDLPMHIIVPAFITSELKKAFIFGFLLFIPFLIIDMIVSSTLMSMGMIMLPPVMISLPFKLMLFVVVNGWDLLINTLVVTYK